MPKKKIKKRVIIALTIALFTIIISFFLLPPSQMLLSYNPKTKNYILHKTNNKIPTQNKNITNLTCDLDGDDKKETISLKKNRLTIKSNSKTIWQTPYDWQVKSFTVADITDNQKSEIALIVWKKGSFGKDLPFWIEKNDQDIKNHLFIFSLKNNTLEPVWQSSALDKPNCQLLIQDLNNDKKNELIVIEGKYQNNTSCKGRYVAIWQWNGWGFANIWRSKKGRYKNLQVEKKAKNKYIIVN